MTHKLIRGYGVTDAAVHDVILFEDVVPEVSPSPDEPYFADAGYCVRGSDLNIPLHMLRLFFCG